MAATKLATNTQCNLIPKELLSICMSILHQMINHRECYVSQNYAENLCKHQQFQVRKIDTNEFVQSDLGKHKTSSNRDSQSLPEVLQVAI